MKPISLLRALDILTDYGLNSEVFVEEDCFNLGTTELPISNEHDLDALEAFGLFQDNGSHNYDPAANWLFMILVK